MLAIVLAGLSRLISAQCLTHEIQGKGRDSK